MVLVIVAVFAVACGGSPSNKPVTEHKGTYGPELEAGIEYVPATVEEVFTNPELFDTNVVIEADMDEICPAGCWFFIKDAGRLEEKNAPRLYATRFKGGFTVPMDLERHRVKVYGVITADNKGEIIEAHRVELLD